MRRLILPLLFASPLLVRAQASLTIDVVTSKPDAGGKMMVALCPNPDAYASDKGCLTKVLSANGGKARAVFLTVPPGQHAVKVFHDVNANGQLDTNKLGIPNEPYGFGNDARGTFGPPAFEEAAITIEQVPVVTAVKLK